MSVEAHPRMIARVQGTLQYRDMEGYRLELLRSGLNPSKGRGSEALEVLRKYLEHMIQELKVAGPPAPMIYRYDNPEPLCEDIEYSYYNIQEPQVYAKEDDVWWALGLIYPCGIPGQAHSIGVCTEFWTMTPMERHSKLHPGSTSKSCLRTQSLCCPVGQACYNEVPEGLQCSGCLEKADEWGYPTFNALFCTRADPSHKKPEPQTLWETAV